MQVTEVKISNQPRAVQCFIEKMDIEMLDAILDINKTYQVFEKHFIINNLQQVFEKFVNYGRAHLAAVQGNCNSCEITKKGLEI